MPPKMLTKIAFTLSSETRILKASVTCASVAPPPDIQEVCRAAAVKFDDVHRGHGQAGAIHEAGDVSIEADVIQPVLGSFDFPRIFLRDIAQGGELRVTIERVVVKVELRIERQHLALRCNDERIHFHHRTIAGDERAIQTIEQLCRVFQLRRLEPKLLRQFACLMSLQPGERIDFLAQDLLGRFLRHRLDLDAAFRARHDDWRCRRAIEQNGKVNFPRDLHRFRHEHFVYDASRRPGLMRHQRLPKHLRRDLARFRRRLAQMHAPFEPIRERPLPSAAGVDLRLDHQIDRPKIAGRLLRFLGR